MNDIMIHIVLATILFLSILCLIIYRKRYQLFKFILSCLVVSGYLVLNHYYGTIKYFEYVPYILIAYLLYVALDFRIWIRLKKNITEFNYFELEKELDDLKDESELLRKRFINTITLINEGLIFFQEGGKRIFLSDKAKEICSLKDNDLSIEEYESIIHPDDVSAYELTVKKLNKKNQNYEIKYRIYAGDKMVWVIEKGKMFSYNNENHIISTIKGLDIKLFPDTFIHELDSMLTEKSFLVYTAGLIEKKIPFYIAMIHLTNIPEINQKFGREVGNLMIAEYIKKMRFHFAKDVNSIFRITGIQFALVITEKVKYDTLHRALISGGDLVNLRLTVGGIEQVIYPNLGVVGYESSSEITVDEIVSIANKALVEAINNNRRNYAVYGEK